ncbi:MAG: diphthine--ammonia ligase [Bacteroidetes bacterium]|nr:diphthine--ammonia ligase [Bacteroidota bacterium]
MCLKETVIFNWSGGKDSALCLHKILQEQRFGIMCLLTTISQPYQRISMHGVRVELLDIQAERIGLPLVKIQIPEMPTMEVYDNTMAAALMNLKNQGVTASVFGDIFLEDLRKYREDKLAELNLKGVFPLWKIPTKKLIREFIDIGFKAITTCVNDKYLDKSFAGRIIDDDFLNDLPDGVDPCGENGEYHSFVYDAPFFSKPIGFEKGEIVYRKYTASEPGDQSTVDPGTTNIADSPFNNGFWYCDLLPR